jgi:GTP-binding protein
VCAFVLIIRHEARYRREFMSYMGESEIPFCIISKADKISKVKIDSHIAATKNMFK